LLCETLLQVKYSGTIAYLLFFLLLDCCYSGSALISEGHEEDAAKIGRTTIDQKSRFGQGKYILSANQAAQEAYALTTGEHSIFTYYLLPGSRGNGQSGCRGVGSTTFI